MTLAIRYVTEAISLLDVDGVSIVDLDAIPEAVDGRRALIMPRPDGFVTGFSIERDSFGTSGAKMTAIYTLNYRLLYAGIGEGRGLFDKYPDMVDAAFRFLDAVLAIGEVTSEASRVVDLNIANALNFGPVLDPAGNAFHGCEIELTVTEFVN